MGIRHAYTATGTNDGAKQVSVDRWNADHSISDQLDFPAITDPSAPGTDVLRVYAKNVGGRMMLKHVGPSGVDTPVQPFLGMNACRIVNTGTGTTAALVVNVFNTAFTASASTYAQSTPATGSRKSKMRRSTLTSAATAGAIAYIKGNYLECALETGFFFVARIGLDTMASGQLGFFGLWSSVTALTATTNPVTSTVAHVGLAFQANTGNWQLVTADGSTVSATDLGANFALNTTDMVELVLFSAPGGVDIKYRVTNMTSGKVVSGTLSSSLPGSAVYMTFHESMANNATAAAVAFSHKVLYLETDD